MATIDEFENYAGEEDFASMLEQFEKKESQRVSEGQIVAIENDNVVVAVSGEKKEGNIKNDNINS